VQEECGSNGSRMKRIKGRRKGKSRLAQNVSVCMADVQLLLN
jgi:hypothetical protein